jgi:hypothetical protein
VSDPKTFPARLLRLAKTIDALAEKDELAMRQADEIATLRCRAAAQLFEECAEFVSALNQVLARPIVTLDPQALPPDAFRDGGVNLIQIHVRGRILQIEFESTPEMLSTEDFRIPYTLAGSVRAFNQAMLDQVLIEEQLIFYTVEKNLNQWRYFDARTYRSGRLDRDYLLGIMAEIV